MLKKVININGMICNHCAKEVKEALESFKQVKSATVHSDIGQAFVDARDELPEDAIASKLAEKGYTLVSIEDK